MRAVLVATSLAAAACVPPPPQTQTSPQPAPGYAAGAPTCATIFQCYGQCQTLDDACVAGCEAGADPTTVANTRAFTSCVIQYQCADTGCMESACSAELAACAASAGAATTAGGAVATGHGSGVHGDVYVGISLTSGGLYDYGSHRVDFRVLMEDGTAIQKLPPVGLDELDLDALRGYLGTMVGTYVWSGDDLEMTFGTYQETLVRRDDRTLDGLKGVSGSFFLADRLDGVVLDGTYSAGTGGAAAKMQFTSDGRFATDRDIYLMATDQSGNHVDLPDGTGTYRIANNTLTLSYDGGQVIQLAIVTLADRGDFPTPDRMFINTYAYARL